MSPWNAETETYVCDRCAEHMTEAEYNQAGLCDRCVEKGYQLVALRPGFWTVVDKRGRELKDVTMEQPKPPPEDTMPSFPHQQPAVDPPTDDDDPDAAMEAELDQEPIVLVDDVVEEEEPPSESTEPTNPAPDADAKPATESPAATTPQSEPTTAEPAGPFSATRNATPPPDASPPGTTTNGTRTEERYPGVVEHFPDPNKATRPTKADLRRLADLLRLDVHRTQLHLVASEDKIERALALGETTGLARAIRALETRFDL